LLLFSYSGELIGDVRRDHLDELLVRRTQLDQALGSSGLVSGPLLSALVIPGPGEALGGFGEIRSGRVDVAGLPGSAHGHIGELAANAVGEDVGDLDRRALGAVSSDGVAVGETVGGDVVEPHLKLTTVGGDSDEGLGFRVDGGDACSL
jgi:hypothetical protein